MSSVHLISDVDALDEVRLMWHALLGETQDPTFFQTFAWFDHIVRQRASHLSPFVLVVRSAGRPIGILPLVKQRNRGPLGTIRGLTSPPAPTAAPFRPIGRNATATLIATARYLRRHDRQWDELALFGLDRDGWNRGRLEDAFANAGFHVDRGNTVSDWYDHCRVPSLRVEKSNSGHVRVGDDEWIHREGVESHAAQSKVTLPGHDFQFVHFRPEAARYGDGDPDWPSFERVFTDSTWGIVEGSGELLSGPADQALDSSHDLSLREIHELASEDGAVDWLAVFAGDDPIAAIYHVAFDGVAVRLLSVYRDAQAQAEFDSLLQSEYRRRFWRSGGRWIENAAAEPLLSDSPRGWVRRRSVGCPARVTPRHQLMRMIRWLRLSRSRVS